MNRRRFPRLVPSKTSKSTSNNRWPIFTPSSSRSTSAPLTTLEERLAGPKLNVAGLQRRQQLIRRSKDLADIIFPKFLRLVDHDIEGALRFQESMNARLDWILSEWEMERQVDARRSIQGDTHNKD